MKEISVGWKENMIQSKLDRMTNNLIIDRY